VILTFSIIANVISPVWRNQLRSEGTRPPSRIHDSVIHDVSVIKNVPPGMQIVLVFKEDAPISHESARVVNRLTFSLAHDVALDSIRQTQHRQGNNARLHLADHHLQVGLGGDQGVLDARALVLGNLLQGDSKLLQVRVELGQILDQLSDRIKPWITMVTVRVRSSIRLALLLGYGKASEGVTLITLSRYLDRQGAQIAFNAWGNIFPSGA
jgi:hypothetical protein